MRCKTKQRKGSRPVLILGYRRITVPQLRDRALGEIRERQMIIPADKLAATEFGLSPSKYEGRFRKRRRPSLLQPRGAASGNAAPQLFQATECLNFAFFCSNGRTFSTSASAVIPCFFRKSGTAPCSMN